MSFFNQKIYLKNVPQEQNHAFFYNAYGLKKSASFLHQPEPLKLTINLSSNKITAPDLFKASEITINFNLFEASKITINIDLFKVSIIIVNLNLFKATEITINTNLFKFSKKIMF